MDQDRTLIAHGKANAHGTLSLKMNAQSSYAWRADTTQENLFLQVMTCAQDQQCQENIGTGTSIEIN